MHVLESDDSQAVMAKTVVIRRRPKMGHTPSQHPSLGLENDGKLVAMVIIIIFPEA